MTLPTRINWFFFSPVTERTTNHIHTQKEKRKKKEKVLDLRKERFGEKKVDVICDNVQHEFKFPKYLLKNVLDWAF